MKRTVIVASLLLIVSAAYVLSFNSYLNEFNSLYSTDGTRLDQCITCHVPGQPYSQKNPYGDDIKNSLDQLGNIVAALQAVENMDSDGDGDINIVEIRAFTFPGDAGSSLPVQSITWGALKHLYE